MRTPNEQRSDRGFDTLLMYMSRRPDHTEHRELSQEVLTDLFTDIRHTLTDYNIDFDQAAMMSEIHFEAEIEEETL